MPTHRELQLDAKSRSGAPWAVLAALLVPFAGFVLGVVYLLRERVGRGIALILLGFVCFGGWSVVLAASAAHSADQAMRRADQTEAEYIRRSELRAAQMETCERKALQSGHTAQLAACDH
jgi:hypothetical protein